MNVAFSIIAIIILVVSILLFRRTRATTKKRPPDPDRLGKVQPYVRFHAVSLENLRGACAAAYAIEGERFLAGATPRIPLPECDAPVCNCHFVHHDDRRLSDNRRQRWTGFVGDSDGTMKEQRDGGDRRNKDPNN
ncbi:conserved protein of unknown function [uncultured Woeseiaceae bacterium]|uniref:Uncharacterized protein n=1 Tax=uncultured Woeseiaceae bacterium TaxID=1983305 RepID=A0A7D9D2S0_9GAMM|nr:conserved protein of unknown function [uncultured Woeseiaceae bacterium]